MNSSFQRYFASKNLDFLYRRDLKARKQLKPHQTLSKVFNSPKLQFSIDSENAFRNTILSKYNIFQKNFLIEKKVN